MRTALAMLAGAILAIVPYYGAASAELVMIEEAGCSWCETWNEAIAPIYPKTEEGRVAPLRRIDIHEPLPEDLDFLVKEHITPAFVVVDGGREIGRIRGYPGEDFFWALLGELLDGIEPSDDASSPTGGS